MLNRSRLMPRSRVSPIDSTLGAIMAPDAALGTSSAGIAVSLLNGASTTAASQLSKMNSILSTVDCIFIAEDDERPPFSEHPMQPAVLSDPTQYFVGAILCTGFVLIIVPLGAWYGMLAKRVFPARGAVSVFVGICMTTLLSYFGPAFYGAATTVIVHSSAGTVCLALFIVILVTAAWLPMLGVVAKFVSERQTASCDDEPHLLSGRGSVYADTDKDIATLPEIVRPFPAYLHPVYEATGDLRRLATRVYFFEDLAVATLFAVIAGVRPTSGNCIGATITLLLVSVAHIVYLGFINPYESRIEQLFAMVNAAVLFAQCLVGCVATQLPGWLPALGVTTLIQAILFFLQFVVSIVMWVLEFIKTGKIFAVNRGAVTRRSAVEVPILSGDSARTASGDRGVHQHPSIQPLLIADPITMSHEAIVAASVHALLQRAPQQSHHDDFDEMMPQDRVGSVGAPRVEPMSSRPLFGDDDDDDDDVLLGSGGGKGPAGMVMPPNWQTQLSSSQWKHRQQQQPISFMPPASTTTGAAPPRPMREDDDFFDDL